MVNWKAIAITFIILFVVESLFLVLAYSWGTASIENETECSVNVCADYDAYYWEDWENMCYCYVGDEIKHEEYIK